MRVDLAFAESEPFDLAVVREERHAAVDLAAERVGVLLLDRVLLGRAPHVGDEQEGRAVDAGEPQHELFIPGVGRGLARTPDVELAFRADACDPPAVRMARLRIRLRASEIPEVPARVGELAERQERVHGCRFAADDPEHAAHVSPACTRSFGGTRSDPSVPSFPRRPSSARRPPRRILGRQIW